MVIGLHIYHSTFTDKAQAVRPLSRTPPHTGGDNNDEKTACLLLIYFIFLLLLLLVVTVLIIMDESNNKGLRAHSFNMNCHSQNIA